MDLEAFLKWEKEAIREERERLNKIFQDELSLLEVKNNACPAEGLENDPKFIKCNRLDPNANASNDQCLKTDRPSSSNLKISSATTSPRTKPLHKVSENPVGLSNETYSLYTSGAPNNGNENAATDLELLSKPAKELANKQTAFSNGKADLMKSHDVPKANGAVSGERKRAKKEDDMEQWVTDTFYSYFPAYNDELQKRQRYLRERQQENQQNLLRHQQEHPPLPRHALKKSKQNDPMDQNVNTTARSSATTTTTSNTTNSSTTMLHPNKKTDLEIIVNNPGYVPPKQNLSRPNTVNRNQLLQDLTHTELSQIVGGDGVTERNRHNAELESARKKDYQRELMQQIEDKRRSVELLREKDRLQEEVLTRRLQEQLKTIQLEEQLEREKIRVDKLRFDSEKNRLMREQLLAKLDKDSRLLNLSTRKNADTNNVKKSDFAAAANKVENAPGTATTADIAAATHDTENNRVYKYFSNSARHEFRRGKPLPEQLELDLDMDTLKSVRDYDDELECFHISEKVCPMCDAPLKSYESCCLRCEKKLSYRRKLQNSSIDGGTPVNSQDEECANNACVSKEAPSYTLVCEKCERLYGLCRTCLAQKEVCRACHRKRNVCLNCRRTLCTRCLDEIACGRDTERSHVNEQAAEAPSLKQMKNKKENDSLQSFQVIEVNYGGQPEQNNNSSMERVEEEEEISPRRDTISHSDSMDSPQKLPYSFSIEKNSIFHADYVPVKQVDSSMDLNLNEVASDDSTNMERVRKETDKLLSRYMRNYGDLALNSRMRSKSESGGNDRSTQTTPHTAARRDIVMNEENNLSMPLLREMPKMTRTESDRMLLRNPIHKISNRIKQLKQRWEVPAVQKFTISANSPKVLTQVGAIRKQLQAEHLKADN